MRFLCLHGSITSADTLSAQLGPLQKNLAADNTGSFYCINAPNSATAPPGQIEYFGPPPHYRWLDYAGVTTGDLHKSVRGGRNIQYATPEEAVRSVISNDIVWTNYQDLMEYVEETLEKNPDIEGLLGYSEGASIGAAYILREQQREQETGRPRRIKCAVFLAGLPPVHPERGLIFADEREDMIDLPTVHVIGAHGLARIACTTYVTLMPPSSLILARGTLFHVEDR
ncbi:hypothetical protein AbraIFM66950_005118 [Aspergillus brasiliensis]|nr:hypothetical protein AbraIFM66950_005118 [Aspergillus brasiliensis]